MGLLLLIRFLVQSAGLIAELLAIPLAFDVGGKTCGLSFTLVLAIFFFVLATVRLVFHGTPISVLGAVAYYGQLILVPSMLQVHLHVHDSIPEWFVRPWRVALAYSTGPFSIMEGFCALIVIQAWGRTLKAKFRSDLAQLVQLLLASLAITADFYLVVRVYAFPEVVGAAAATLIGAALTITLSLGVFGIWSNRGSVVESTLLFSYIVYVIYLTFTDFQSTLAPSSLFPFLPKPPEPTHPSLLAGFWQSRSNSNEPLHLLSPQTLPPVIMDNYANLVTALTRLMPQGVRTLWAFCKAAIVAITPSVVVSLVVRLTSFFLAMRIVPYIRRGDGESRTLSFIYRYSPVMIIAVYTHLLLQHFGGIVHVPQGARFESLKWSNIWMSSRQAWQFWGWVNVFSTLTIYAVELFSGPAHNQVFV